MRRAAAVALLAVLALAGCGGSSTPSTQPTPKPKVTTPGDEAVIRDWTDAVYTGQFEKAARLFAPGAIVQQSKTFVLKTHEEAVVFNSTLPCSAKLTGVVREKSGLLLASFDLFKGPLGGCPTGGHARVRFRIRRGLIELWRQLPDAPAPAGQNV